MWDSSQGGSVGTSVLAWAVSVCTSVLAWAVSMHKCAGMGCECEHKCARVGGECVHKCARWEQKHSGLQRKQPWSRCPVFLSAFTLVSGILSFLLTFLPHKASM